MFKLSLLAALLSGAALAQNPTATVTVDANANRHAIDPRIYGLAYGTAAQLSDLNVPLNRYGGNKVMLIPRLRGWVNTYYDAGTPIGITEYNWGAEPYINGATTQADILGIFGREGLNLAARWTTPDASTPTYKAIKLYRNYDGNTSSFGDMSVSASGPNPDSVAVFAAQRTADSALTVMVINKYLSGNTPVSLALNNFAGDGTAQVYQLTSANAITRLTDLGFSGNTAAFTAPPQSITLLVLPMGTANVPPVAKASATPASGSAPLTVNFSSTGSNDPDGSIASYIWNFGDGTAASSSASPMHVYQNAGSFTAILTVTDNLGATGTASTSVSVSGNLLVAPANLTGAAGKGSVTLKWTDASTYQTGFYVERAPSGSTSFVRVGTVAGNVKTLTNTVSKGTYLYRVQAYNTTNGVSSVSVYSNTVTVKVTH